MKKSATRTNRYLMRLFAPGSGRRAVLLLRVFIVGALVLSFISWRWVNKALAAAGDLDTSFATRGKLTDAFYRGGRALALQPDGKVVVGGYGDYSSHGQTGDFRLFRLNGNGTLDQTFDGDGRASATMGDFANLWSLVIQPDGKIVAAGSASTAGNNDFAIARFNANGMLDQTFDGDGRLRLDFSTYDEANAVLLQPDGKFVLTGFFANGPHSGSTYDFTLVRLNGDGSLDSTFGTSGRVVTDFFGSGDRAFDAVLQSDGKIVAAGDAFVSSQSKYDFALARYNSDGALDTSFGGDGKVTTAVFDGYEERAWRVALQPDGKLLAGGGTSNSSVYPVIPTDTVLARYNLDGTLDTTFDGDGLFVRDLSGNGQSDDVRGLIVQSNGKILIADSHPNLVETNPSHYDLALVRLLPNGQLDSGFGSSGKVLTDFGDVENPPAFGATRTGEAPWQDIVLQPDGKILASTASIVPGGAGARVDIGVARYQGDAVSPPLPTPTPTPNPTPTPTPTPLPTPTPTPAPAALGLFDASWRGYDTGTFSTGFAPNSIAVGDLDGDGDRDVLAGNSFFSRPGLSVLKNLGNGTYGPFVNYALPNNQGVSEVALSDIDGDGDLDVLATIPGSFETLAKLALWRNNGDGTFASRVEFTTGTGPVGLIVADFTGDTFPDAVTANSGSGTISLLRHNGLAGASAGFLSQVAFTVGANCQRLAAADLNGDGRLDLAVGRWSGLSVLFNNGAGGFGAPTDYFPVPSPNRGLSSAVVLADIDNDGDADLIGGGALDAPGSISYGVVSVMRNAGNGTFGTPQLHRFDNFVFIPRHITTSDLNADGFLDVIATTPSGRASDGYNVLLSNGSGGFFPAAFYHASKQTYATAPADADLDGDPDIITVAQDSAAITVHFNPGNGVFPLPPRYLIGDFTEALDSADIDRDGDLDIVTNDDLVRILRNNGNGTFAPVAIHNVPRNFADMKLRDLNGDNYPDLLLGPDAEHPPYDFGVSLNQGNGTFATPVVTVVSSCGQGSIDAFDLDNDGDRDVILTEEQGCAGGAQARIFIARNNGSGQFTLLPPLIPPGFAIGIAGADLNSDGNIDLVTSLGAGIGVYLGNGNLTFQPPLISSTSPYKFTLADFNRDGKLDVGMIVPQGSFGTVLVGTALGLGDGTFAPTVTQTGSSGLETAFRISSEVGAADADLDGDPDLFFSNNASNDVSLFLNNGDGSLRPQQRYGVSYSPQHFALADFTGDARVDVAVQSSLPPSGVQDVLVILRNLSSGSTPTPTPTPTPTATPTPTPTPPPPGAMGLQYYSLAAPVRLLDTRAGQLACDAPGTPLAGGTARTQVARTACSAIPAGAQALVGNATVVNTDGEGDSGFITLYPNGAARPTASNLNYVSGQIVPNAFTVGLGADGAFQIYASTATDFIVDVTGYYAPPAPAGLYYHPLPAPVRLLDTRAGQPACDNPSAPLTGGATRTEAARLSCGGMIIPPSAMAVVGNATVVNDATGAAGGYITLYASGVAQPAVSNLNYISGQIVPNAFTVGLGADGAFNIYASSSTNLIVDITGYYSDQPTDMNGAGLLYHPLSSPMRLLDTRPNQPACNAPGGPLVGNSPRTELAHVTCGGMTIPNTAQAVVGNATVVNNTGADGGFVTLYPSGATLPTVSNLNYSSGQIVPNAFTVGLGFDGALNIYATSGINFIVDIAGYYAP